MEIKSFDDLKGMIEGFTALIEQFVDMIKAFVDSWKKELKFETEE